MNIVITHVFSWLLLGIACFWVTRSWHVRPRQGVWLRWQHLKRRIVQGNPGYRARVRGRLLDINPLLWLTSRDRSLRIFLTGFFIVLTVSCYAMNCSRWFHWSHIASPMACFVFLHVLFLLLVAFEAASYLIERRRDDALELILSTSLTTNEILRGHWLAAQRLFHGALITMAVYAAAWMITAWKYALPGNRFLAIVFPLLMMANLLVSAHALVWCTMSYSFRARWHSGPALLGFGVIVALPFCWMGLVCFPALSSTTGLNTLVVWLVITFVSIINARGFVVFARTNLEENFRQKMTEPKLRKARTLEG
jgi:hypothetical protein